MTEKKLCFRGQREGRPGWKRPADHAACTTPERPAKSRTGTARYSSHERRRVP